MTDVELYKEEPRIGTFAISKGFDRDHFKLLRLIEKYENLFSKLGILQKRRIPSSKAGRPVDEFLLNNKQLLFLSSLLRASGNMADFKCSAIYAGNMLAVVEALYTFDFGDVYDRKVYAAMDEKGNIKIGISSDPERRLKELQSTNAYKLKLVFVSKAKQKGYLDETYLHKICDDYRIHGEWFNHEALALITNKTECRASEIGAECSCPECLEYSAVLEALYLVDDPENNQQKAREEAMSQGFSPKLVDKYIEISNDIGWP